MSEKLIKKIYTTWQQAKDNIINGVNPAYIEFDSHPIVGSGAKLNFGQDYSISVTPNVRNYTALSPEASILIKKKVFSSLKGSNDLRFMDKTEKMLLRATKALFAYKVQQIRAYESLTKVERFLESNNSYNLNLLNSLLIESSAIFSSYQNFRNNIIERIGQDDLLEIFSEASIELVNRTGAAEKYSQINNDILQVLKRDSFSRGSGLTEWVVDPSSAENYILGPGTGVIDLGLFTNFNTQTTNDPNPSSASFSLSYPYRIGTVSEEDIDIAIEEALRGTLGIFSELLNSGMASELLSQNPDIIDGSASIASAFALSGSQLFDSSLDVDYIREKLRIFYLGKSFINVSDVVHFYIRGNRTYENYDDIQAGEAAFDKEYLQIDETILKAEYQLYTNQNMDYETYKKIRSKQDSSFGMIHVYAGLVTSIDESFSSGFWNLSISCTDNMSWLTWSRFQSEPPLSDPKNVLEDPLTPFDFSKDDQGAIIPSSRDLLYENKQLLESGLLSYDSGLFAGQNAIESNLIQGQYNGIGSLNGKKIIQHPSGFVYRWKSGILTATTGFAIADPTEELNEAQTWNQQYALTITNTVINNLDIPNILSILIVGQPYNIETFLDQAFTSHNIRDKSGRLNPLDPLTGVLDTIRKQNKYYGAFYPYRTISMNSATVETVLSNAQLRDNANNSIRILKERKVAIRSRIRELKKSPINTAAVIASLEAEIRTIDIGIKNQIKAATASNRALTSEENVGIQISLGGSTSLPVSPDDEEASDITRAMMMVGAQRRIEDVRLNRDRNLLIISDQYDSSDIRPFILQLNNSNWKLFEGKYINTWQICSEATKYLNLEFFANTQGHLEFRPPLWNRIPISVLRDAIKRQKKENKQVIPKFITDLFQTRVEALYLNIHVLNIKIALAALMLGRYPDRDLIPNVPFSGSRALSFFGIEENDQAFLSSNQINKAGNWLSGQSSDPSIRELRLKQTEFESSENTKIGTFARNNFDLSLSFQDKGDILNGNTDRLLGVFDQIIQEQSTLFVDVENVINSGGGKRPQADYSVESLNAIRNSFRRQFGRDPASGLIPKDREFIKDDLIYNSDNIERAEKALYGKDSLLSKISKAISDRDSFVSMLQANLAKTNELEEIEEFLKSGNNQAYEAFGGEGDSEFVQGINRALTGAADFLQKSANSIQAAADIITGKMSEGTVYDHLLEDDDRNLLGYGSGKRFILEDAHIISAKFNEASPEFTRVDVLGNAPLGFGDNINRGFDGLYFWAGGTDFDLWRQYGYKSKEIRLPFVSDPEGQGKPYAILELAMQKLKINKGSVTIVGNEFYQPGDTVYIPSKGLLYYIKSVSHSFSFGSSFTTTLTLEYGHPPGDYIPSPLDVIGQQLVSNFLEDPAIVYRSDESDDNYRLLRPDSSLVFPTGEVDAKRLLSFSDNQTRFTNMMIDLINSTAGSNYVLIRGFAMDENDEEGIREAKEKLEIVRSLLQNPRQLKQGIQFGLADDLVSSLTSPITTVSSLFGGGSVGTVKELEDMRLPNNLPVYPIPAGKIIEQISYFKKIDRNKVGQLSCLNRELQSALQYDLSEEISDNISSGIFPKGGPRQDSWLDLRDEISGFKFTSSFKSNVIEVGIIKIPSSLLKKKLPNK